MHIPFVWNDRLEWQELFEQMRKFPVYGDDLGSNGTDMLQDDQTELLSAASSISELLFAQDVYSELQTWLLSCFLHSYLEIQ